jgi:hypothetical protein
MQVTELNIVFTMQVTELNIVFTMYGLKYQRRNSIKISLLCFVLSCLLVCLSMLLAITCRTNVESHDLLAAFIVTILFIMSKEDVRFILMIDSFRFLFKRDVEHSYRTRDICEYLIVHEHEQIIVCSYRYELLSTSSIEFNRMCT